MANSFWENPQFQAAVSASQQLLGQAAAPSNVQNNSAVPQAVGVPAAPLSAAAVRLAAIAHYKRVLATCVAN